MNTKRREQWNLRLERLVSLRERFTRTYRYDRARRACRVIHFAYDRWATEVFASERALGEGVHRAR
jgi:hypothetical protein